MNRIYFQYIDNDGDDFCIVFRSEESLNEHITKHNITKILYKSNEPFPFRGKHAELFGRLGKQMGVDMFTRTMTNGLFSGV